MQNERTNSIEKLWKQLANERTNNINKLWRQLTKFHALLVLAEQVIGDVNYKLFDSTNGYGKEELTSIFLDLEDLKDQAEKLKSGMADLWAQEVNKKQQTHKTHTT